MSTEKKDATTTHAERILKQRGHEESPWANGFIDYCRSMVSGGYTPQATLNSFDSWCVHAAQASIGQSASL